MCVCCRVEEVLIEMPGEKQQPRRVLHTRVTMYYDLGNVMIGAAPENRNLRISLSCRLKCSDSLSVVVDDYYCLVDGIWLSQTDDALLSQDFFIIN